MVELVDDDFIWTSKDDGKDYKKLYVGVKN